MLKAFVASMLILSALISPGEIEFPPQDIEEESEVVVVTVDSTNLRFSPSTVTISEGDTVRFFWSGQALPHNAVENSELFDSGEPNRAVDYSFTFEGGLNGSFEYVCEPHEAVGMVGTIIVEQSSQSEPENNESDNKTSTMNQDTNSESGVLNIIYILIAIIFLFSIFAVIYRVNEMSLLEIDNDEQNEEKD
jgi:plastocyanin